MKKDGFTLIEVIIFIVVAGIIAAAIFIPFTTNLKESITPEKIATAVYLSKEKMEELTKYAYDDSNIDPISTSFSRVNLNPSHPFYNYWWQWQISWVDENLLTSSDVGYKSIVITLKYPNDNDIVFQTLVTRRPADE
jgi:prepilin-type N-terminal cleavage/methylation domain-containing protein